LEEVTIAEALKKLRLQNGNERKWHVGCGQEYFPEYQGFDVNKGGNWDGITQGVIFIPMKKNGGATPMTHILMEICSKKREKGEYLTDRLNP